MVVDKKNLGFGAAMSITLSFFISPSKIPIDLFYFSTTKWQTKQLTIIKLGTDSLICLFIEIPQQ